PHHRPRRGRGPDDPRAGRRAPRHRLSRARRRRRRALAGARAAASDPAERAGTSDRSRCHTPCVGSTAMLSVEVGDTPEELVEALASSLARPLDDPFAAEWVSVPSFGFRSWLRLRLAERLGAGGSGAGVVA